MPFDLDLSTANPLFDRLRDVFSPSTSDQILLTAGQRVGQKAEQIIQDNLYPPASGKALPLWYTRERVKDGKTTGETYRSKFKSAAQQRLVMSLVGQSKVPFRRNGELGRSIVSRARLTGEGLLVIDIGSKLLWAPYVIDRKMQSKYHLGTWKTIQDDFEEHLPELRQVGVNAIVQEVNRRIKG